MLFEPILVLVVHCPTMGSTNCEVFAAINFPNDTGRHREDDVDDIDIVVDDMRNTIMVVATEDIALWGPVLLLPSLLELVVAVIPMRFLLWFFSLTTYDTTNNMAKTLNAKAVSEDRRGRGRRR